MSFTSSIPAPQKALKGLPVNLDYARFTEKTGVSIYMEQQDTLQPSEAQTLYGYAQSTDASHPADTALGGPNVYGVLLRIAGQSDTILSTDFNSMVDALKAKLSNLYQIGDLLASTKPDVHTQFQTLVNQLESSINSMPTVKTGDKVYSTHYNALLGALRTLLQIEELLVNASGSPADMSQLLSNMRTLVASTMEKKTGDIVTHVDWNNLKQALGYAPAIENKMIIYLKIVVLIGDAPSHSAPSGLTLGIFTSAYGGDPGRDAIMFTSDDLDYVPVVQSLAQKGIRVFGVYYPHHTGDYAHDAEAHFRYETTQTNGKLYYGNTGWDTQMVNDILALLPPGTFADIAFVVDVTGSMSSDLASIKTKIKSVIDTLPTDRVFRFGLASFRDYPGSYSSYGYSATYGYTGDWPWKMHADLTTDRSAVKSAVDALEAYGGADLPECYTRALYESQFFSWRY